MKVDIRPANLAREKPQLVELLRKNLNPLTDESRFDWLFLNGPVGPASIWVAVEDESGEIIGSGAALARRMFVGGNEVTGCVFADFWIDPRHRILGPAVKLQRACLDAVDGSQFALAYDFPRQGMPAVYRRLGIPATRSIVRMVRPLDVGRQVKNRLGAGITAHCAARIANAILRWRDATLARPRHYEVSPAPLTFGPQFTQLARSAASRHSLWVARTADYLNWRFRDHFRLRYELLTATLDSRLEGYAILLDDETSTNVVDLFWCGNRRLLGDLLAGVILLARERGKEGVNVPIVDAPALLADLSYSGFHARERQPFVVHPAAKLRELLGPDHEAGWLFTAGDESD